MASTGYKRLLTANEHRAIEKLKAMHEPMMKELEKWKVQREKVENKIWEHMNTMGNLLEPYCDQSQWKKAWQKVAAYKLSSHHPNKKASSTKKSRPRKS